MFSVLIWSGDNCKYKEENAQEIVSKLLTVSLYVCIKSPTVTHACLWFEGGWGISGSFYLMCWFVSWCSLAWSETPGELWSGRLRCSRSSIYRPRIWPVDFFAQCWMWLLKNRCLFVLQSMSAGRSDSHHQLGLSGFGAGCCRCKCCHGNMAGLPVSAVT